MKCGSGRLLKKNEKGAHKHIISKMLKRKGVIVKRGGGLPFLF
jgi:hypothetical protein